MPGIGRTETAGQVDLNESILPLLLPKRANRGGDISILLDLRVSTASVLNYVIFPDPAGLLVSELRNQTGRFRPFADIGFSYTYQI